MLMDIFVRIESFFKRLESYTEVPPTTAMADVIVKIMIEVLSILAIATKEIKQGRSSEYIDLRILFALDLLSSRKICEETTRPERYWRCVKAAGYAYDEGGPDGDCGNLKYHAQGG